MSAKRRLGDLLVSAGLLSAEEAATVAEHGQANRLRFASAAIDLGMLSELEVLQVLAKQYGVPAVDLTRSVLTRDALEQIPHEVAAREGILPLRIEESNLMLAMMSPDATQIHDEIAFVTGLCVRPYVALRSRLQSTLAAAYATTSGPYRGPRASSDTADAGGWVAVVPEAKLEQSASLDIQIEEGDVDDADDPIELDTEEIEAIHEDYAHWHSETAKTVMLIDDEAEILRLLVETTRTIGVNIVTASDGAEGLMKIRRLQPDLVVTDAMLPEVHGFEIARKLKGSRRFASTPILMISAIYRGWRIAADIKKTYQVDAFLEKPFRIPELQRQIRRLLNTTHPTTSVDENKTASQHYRRGQAAYKAGNDLKAYDELKTAEAADPLSPTIQFLLGRVLERQGRALQAIHHYELAVELNPEMFVASKNLALLYQAQGFRSRAKALWERALGNAPSQQVREQIKNHLASFS